MVLGHPLLDAAQLALILINGAGHRFGLRIGFGDALDLGPDGRIVKLKGMGASDLANHQANRDLLLHLLPKQRIRQGRGVHAAAALGRELVEHRLLAGLNLPVHQGRRQLDAVQAVERIHHLGAEQALHSILHFPPHVAGDLLAKRRQAAVLDAHRLEEGLVELRQPRLLHLFDDNIEADRAAAKRLVGIVVGKGGIKRLGLPLLKADHGCVEVLPHLAGAEEQRHVLAAAAVKGLAVKTAVEVHPHPVVLGGNPRDGMPGALLLAQGLEHQFDVGIGDFRLRAPHFDGGQIAELNFRQNLEDGSELQIEAGLHGQRLQAGNADRRQRFPQHGVLIACAHGFLRGIGPHGGSKPAPHFLQGHLAGAEAGQAGLCLEVEQLVGHFALKLLGGNHDGQSALHAGENFH